MFVYFAVPAFWFFMLSFVFLSRMLIFQKAIQNHNLYATLEEQKQALLRFYGFFCKKNPQSTFLDICTFIAVIYFS